MSSVLITSISFSGVLINFVLLLQIFTTSNQRKQEKPWNMNKCYYSSSSKFLYNIFGFNKLQVFQHVNFILCVCRTTGWGEGGTRIFVRKYWMSCSLY
jgi:hypothetical protein